MTCLLCSHMFQTFRELSFIIFSSPMSRRPVLSAWTTTLWLKTFMCPFAIKRVSGHCSSRNAWKKKQLFFSSVDFPWNIQRKADAIQLFHTWFSVILAHLKPLLCLESCPHVWCDMQLFELFSVTCDSWMDKLSGLIVARLDNFCWILWLWKWSLCFTC